MKTKKTYDLRDYSKLIRDCVSELDKQDKCYKWTVKNLSDTQVDIYWGYLDGETNDSFSLQLKTCQPVTGEWYITCRTPDGEMINGEIIVDVPQTRWDYTLPMAIQMLIKCIGLYAHSRY